MLLFKVIEQPVAYTGRELRTGFAGEHAGTTGEHADVALGFVGPCNVATEDLVDLDDARAGATIVAAEMAHALIEHRNTDLRTGVLRQRLLVCILAEALGRRGLAVCRDGDDLYVDDRKLTVSIAAPGPDSVLIHLGINVKPEGAPVAAVGIAEFDIDPFSLLTELFERYGAEMESARHAETKVREVE